MLNVMISLSSELLDEVINAEPVAKGRHFNKNQKRSSWSPWSFETFVRAQASTPNSTVPHGTDSGK